MTAFQLFCRLKNFNAKLTPKSFDCVTVCAVSTTPCTIQILLLNGAELILWGYGWEMKADIMSQQYKKITLNVCNLIVENLPWENNKKEKVTFYACCISSSRYLNFACSSPRGCHASPSRSNFSSVYTTQKFGHNSHTVIWFSHSYDPEKVQTKEDM